MKSLYISIVLSVLPYLYTCEEFDLQAFLDLTSEAALPEDGKLNFTGLALKYGHKAEEYEVITDDGYILTIFRLPGKKPPVLLMHGICDTADSWVLRGYSSLGITLADAGYDVWVGNVRGNKYARRHVTLDPDTDVLRFWDFSFHEMGLHDLPKTIDFILEKTGKESLSTIAHSQGTTMHLVCGSLKPEYNDKIKVAIGLAPVAFMNNIQPPLSIVLRFAPAINDFLPLSVQELPRDHGLIKALIKFVCSKGLLSYDACAWEMISPFSNFNPKTMDPEFLKVFVGHHPGSCSRKSLFHFDQNFFRGTFGQWDYGTGQNLIKYGAASPPEYDLSAVTMKTALIAGKNDKFGNIKDVEHLQNRLPNVVHFKILDSEQWTYLDFIINEDMPKLLFPSIVNILEEHNNCQ